MRFPVLLSLFVLPGLAQAQQPPSTLTVDDAVAIAIKNNPRVSAATHEVLAARSGVRSARAFPNPEIAFVPGITSLSGTGEELLVSQRLELNGTRAARGGIAGAQLRRTQALAVAELRDIVFDVKSAYYELMRAREQQALTADLLTSAEEFDRRIRRLVEEGKRPGIELAQTGIEVTRAQQQLTLAVSQVTVAIAALNTLMGRSAVEPIGPLPPLGSSPNPVDEESVLRQALAARTEIAAEEAQGDSFRQEARLARAEGLPDLAPQIRIGSLIRGIPEASSGNGFGVGIGITIPILDYGSRRNRIRQAEEAARAQSDRARAQRNQVRQEVTQAVARLRAAEVVLQSYQQGILDRARQLLEAARIGLQEGQPSVTVLTVLEAQRTYRNVQTEYINAQVSQALARAELERATGAVHASLIPQPRK